MSADKRILVERFKGWALGIINGIDARMLVDMIKADDIPTLWEYQLPPYLSFVKGLVIENKDAILEQLTLEAVMKYCKEYRQDLAKILVHKKAQEWMHRFLKKTAFMIKHIDLEPYEIQIKYEERIKELLAQREVQQAEQIANLMYQAPEPKEEEEKEVDKSDVRIPKIEKIDYDSLTDEDLARALGKEKITDDYDFL